MDDIAFFVDVAGVEELDVFVSEFAPVGEVAADIVEFADTGGEVDMLVTISIDIVT